MPAFRLELPIVQNWSCHNCGGCCRQHLIELSDEEKRRIESQKWTEADGLPAGRPIFVPMGGWLEKKRFRLGHQADGGCIFLNEQGLCRIHARFGEEAKPLACRIYPFAFHPARGDITVSLRFSCPSVVRNLGTAVEEQSRDLQKLAKLVVPESAGDIPPPPVHSNVVLDWDDTLRIVEALIESLSDEETPFLTRLRRTVFWVQLLGQAKFDKIRGDRLDELLQILAHASREEVPERTDEVEPPTGVGRMHFRMLAALYARKDTTAALEHAWSYRWKLFRAALRFARGKGDAPPLQEAFCEVPFELLEKPVGGLPEGADELFGRYFEVKLFGLHFCGRAYYGLSVVDGFLSLALIVPVICFFSRWLALSQGRTGTTLADFEQAMTIADHHHGYSPALGQSPAIRRLRQLVATGDIPRLITHYSR